MLNNTAAKKVVKLAKMTPSEVVPGTHVAIPMAAIEEVSTRFANTLFGYFIGWDGKGAGEQALANSSCSADFKRVDPKF
ncbi:hypothetical protein Tco_1047456 [Tanacetum coccineum]